MASQKQKVAAKDKEKEIQRRLASAETAFATRKRIAEAHGTFPDINSLIKETREGAIS